MTNLENESKPPISEREDCCSYEDEINLIDYILILWRRKYFIFLASVLPALIAGFVFFSLPRNYQVTYVYDVESPGDDFWQLNEKNYNLLISRFYSEENLAGLIDELRKNGLEKYAKQIADSSKRSEKLVKFDAVPPFPNVSKINAANIEQIEKIREMRASLLNVVIIGCSRDDMYEISSVIRDNIENIIPVYVVRDLLSKRIKEYNNNLAEIERDRFSLSLALSNTSEVLAKLRKIETGVTGEKLDNVLLQFNVGEQSQYLPLSYQIQAAESKRIKLEGDIKANEENYKYYADLLDLNNKILVELNSKLSTNYTVGQFKSFLTELADICEKPQLKDYLNSYIRKMENRIFTGKPAIEKPMIYPIAKGTAKKIGIVFMIALMLSIFTAFLLRSLEKNSARI